MTGESTFPSDLELVARCNRGEATAFEALYLKYHLWVLRVARRFTGSDGEALDVLQEVFTYLLGKFPGFTLTCRFTTFLYPVVKHTALAFLRKRKRFESWDECAAEKSARPPQELREEDVLTQVVNALPEGQREVLLMRFVDGMSISEIAEALGIAEGTVKSRIHRALEALRSDPALRRYFEEEP